MKLESHHLLLVEDDPDLCKGWQELFELVGHRLTTHQRSRTALADKDTLTSVDLLITDYYLPDLNGIELIREARTVRADLPAILLTGSREKEILESADRLHDCLVLHKPVNFDDLLVSIALAIRLAAQRV